MCNFIFKPVIFVNFTEPLMINNKLSQHRNTEGLLHQATMRHLWVIAF